MKEACVLLLLLCCTTACLLLLSALGILVGRPPATISARAAQIFAAERTAEAVEAALLALEPGDPAIGGLAAELVATGPGVPQPALSSEIEGDWLLLFTSKSDFDPRSPLGRRTDGGAPGLEGAFEQLTGGAVQASASPIQRAVTSAFKVVQTISLRGSRRQGRSGRDAGRPVQVAVAVGVRLDLGGATGEDRL